MDQLNAPMSVGQFSPSSNDSDLGCFLFRFTVWNEQRNIHKKYTELFKPQYPDSSLLGLTKN